MKIITILAFIALFLPATLVAQPQESKGFQFSTTTGGPEFTFDGKLITESPLGIGLSYKPSKYTKNLETGLYLFPAMRLGDDTSNSSLGLGLVVVAFKRLGVGLKWRAWKEGIGFKNYSAEDLAVLLSFDLK